MKDQKVNVAIAGLGFGASVHIPAILSNSRFKLVGIWHPRQEVMNSIKKEYEINDYQDWTSLISDNNVDAVIIATPPAPRYKLAKEALLAGKHILLEKPVTLNTSQAEDLQRIALRSNLKVAVDFEYRAVPLFMQAKRIIERKNLKTPWFIKLDWLMNSRANPDRPWNWYSNNEEGGGVIGALGTHAFDILHWLYGPTSSVSGLVSTSIKKRVCPSTQSIKDVTSEDVCIAQLEIKSPTHLSTIIPAQVNLSAVTRASKGFSLEIYCKNGTLVLSSENQNDYVHGFGLWLSENGEQTKSIQPDSDLAFQKTWRDGRIAPVARLQNWWANSILNGEPMIPGLIEGILSQKVCDNLKDSSNNGHKIELSYK